MYLKGFCCCERITVVKGIKVIDNSYKPPHYHLTETEELDKEILADTKRICLKQELKSIGVKINRLDW